MDDETRRMQAAMRAQMAVKSMTSMLTRPTLTRPAQPKLPPLPPEEPVLAEVSEAVKKIKHSKKLDLSKLPKTWRGQIFDALKPEKQSRLVSAVALLWATGCRPVEIEKGVKVQMIAGQLVVEIRGGKHGLITNDQGTFERGLEWRRLTINPNLNAATKYLAVLAENGQVHSVDYNRNSLRTRLNETGRLALKKLKNTPSVSPYLFRHAMGSDLKSCDDMTDEQKSQIMGHLSVDSLSVYGRRRHAGGVSPVAQVEASAVPHGEYTDAPKKAATKPKNA